METNEKTGTAPRFSRRRVLAGGAAALGASAISWKVIAGQIEELKQQGWEASPCACKVCGGGCGLLILKKKGEKPSLATVRVFPNPAHPQRGMCGRAAQAVMLWASPLRLKKPLKRTGARGEGKFKEVSWEEALDGIAAELKKIVERYGDNAAVFTSHSFSGVQKWASWCLGTPNQIGHQSTCNTASNAGRILTFGAKFANKNKIDPDYDNASVIVLVGRSINCPMGVAGRLAEARDRGAKIIFVNPWQPDAALGLGEWVPVTPGTDGAFLLSLIQVMIREKLYDEPFLARQTNAAYLVASDDGRPLTRAELEGTESDADKALFAVRLKTGGIAFQGLRKETVRDEKTGGTKEVLSFVENPAQAPEIDWSGEVKTRSGALLSCRTAFAAFRELAAKFEPAQAAGICGVPEKTIVSLARLLCRARGVVEDGWYSSRNGNDVELSQLLCVINAFIGNVDQKGGLCVMEGAGLSSASVKFDSKTKTCTAPGGETWQIANPLRADRALYPDAPGAFFALEKALFEQKPYPVKALFVTGTNLLQREAGTERMRKMLAAFELVVVQDVMPQETCDFADYVLPSTFFLEQGGVSGIEFTREMAGAIQKSAPGLPVPEGCEARDDLFALMEIVRRAFPERAARLGYTRECRTNAQFREWKKTLSAGKGYGAFMKELEAADPEKAAAVKAGLDKDGWALTRPKAFGAYPFKKPFDTPTGKMEIYSFWTFLKPARKALPALPVWEPVKAYRLPRGKDEFYTVSGKNLQGNSGLAMFGPASRAWSERRAVMNPEDAANLGIGENDLLEIQALDTGFKEKSRVHLSRRIRRRCLYMAGFSGGTRSKLLRALSPEDAGWMEEGVNPNWFASGWASPVFGALANNGSVSVRKISG
ncbi:molybdopterin-dependent oxidoreductase [Mesosutterella sp. AGMB02718]|uniref:Molybdopterin-dependent oxidoreductase n=1 Tax=Mesosutterella faecium TaxID=2925194 RepID=A0ABT7IPI6_9BURK|nr:molybdopterin-dependent oxidoreductase [Mesosutterella sp. AGMB02718]MDL2059808.1 molybdopterin-dependent oxidoreductase [Mesosutterella sp. AGMB02718]